MPPREIVSRSVSRFDKIWSGCARFHLQVRTLCHLSTFGFTDCMRFRHPPFFFPETYDGRRANDAWKEGADGDLTFVSSISVGVLSAVLVSVHQPILS